MNNTMAGKNALVATVGDAPEVVTEVLDKLTEESIPIDEVIVLHTNDVDVIQGCRDVHGYFDEMDNAKGKPVWRKGLERNPRFPDQSYLKQEVERVGVQFRYPKPPYPHSDIQKEQQSSEFAQHLLGVILAERLNGNTVYVSIAGGRKTMSAYALLGAILFGARQVFHVLVSKEIEDELRLKERFHVKDIDLSLLKDRSYDLIPIPVPELRYF